MRQRRGPRDGRLPPARRLGDLRHPGAARPGLRHAVPADRPAGELRVDRQRPRRGHAVHRGAPRSARHRDAPRHRRGHGGLRPELRRVPPGAARPPGPVPEPARQRRVRDRRRDGHQHPAAQPAGVHRRMHRVHREPGHRRPGPDEAREGTRLPHRRHHRRVQRDQGRLRDGPRPRGGPRACAHRAAAPGQGGDHRHRAALPGVQGRWPQRRQRPDQEDRRAGEQRPAQGDLRPPRRVRQVRHPARDRDEARRHPEGRAEQPLQVHDPPEHLRREHGGARRQRAAHARPAPAGQELRGPPARRGGPPDPARAPRARGSAAHPRGPPGRDREARRGDRADPRRRGIPTPPARA